MVWYKAWQDWTITSMITGLEFTKWVTGPLAIHSMIIPMIFPFQSVRTFSKHTYTFDEISKNMAWFSVDDCKSKPFYWMALQNMAIPLYTTNYLNPHVHEAIIVLGSDLGLSSVATTMI